MRQDGWKGLRRGDPFPPRQSGQVLFAFPRGAQALLGGPESSWVLQRVPFSLSLQEAQGGFPPAFTVGTRGSLRRRIPLLFRPSCDWVLLQLVALRFVGTEPPQVTTVQGFPPNLHAGALTHTRPCSFSVGAAVCAVQSFLSYRPRGAAGFPVPSALPLLLGRRDGFQPPHMRHWEPQVHHSMLIFSF